MIRPQLFTNHKISKGVTPVRRTGNFLKLASVAAVGALSFGVTPFASAQEADVATGSPFESASMRELAEDSTVLDVAPVDEAQPETASATAQPTAEPQQSDLTKASPAATTAPVTPKAASSSSSVAPSSSAATSSAATSSTATSSSAAPQKNNSLVQEDSVKVASLGSGMFKVTLKTNERTAGGDVAVPPVTLSHENTNRATVTAYPALVNNEKIDTAFASAEKLKKDYDLLSFDLYEVATAADGEVSFIYEVAGATVDEKAEQTAWKVAGEDQKSAFVLGDVLDTKVRTLEVGTRSAAGATTSTAPKVPEGPATIAPSIPEISSAVDFVDRYPGATTNNTRYYGPLNDVGLDFGTEYEQSPERWEIQKDSSHMDSGDWRCEGSRFTYPMRHRNWSTGHYPTNPGDRPIRGPIPLGFNDTGRERGQDNVVYRENEQGYFYSRDHVQYAWSTSTSGIAPVYRGEEFVLGGGDPDAVWYGGTFTTPRNGDIDWNENYRQSGRPGFKLYIDDQVNIDTWEFQRFKDGHYWRVAYFSPNKDVVVEIGSRGGKGDFNINFYDYQQMVDAGVLRDNKLDIPKIARTGGYSKYNVGIPTPNWTRVFLGYGSGGLNDKNADNLQNLACVNSYLAGEFVPIFELGPQTPPTEPTPSTEPGKLTVEKSVTTVDGEKTWHEDNETGKKYIDYTIDVKAPEEKGKYFYKVEDTPDFGAGLKVSDLKIMDVTGKSSSEFAVTEARTSDGQLKFTISQKDARTNEYSDYLEIWENQTHSIDVRAYFDVPEDLSITDQKCSAGHGLYNEALLNVYGSDEKPSDDACATYNQKGKDPEPEDNVTITKEVVEASTKQAWAKDNSGKYYIDYTLKVETAPGAKSLYKIRETPDFGPNIKVTDLQIREVKGKRKDDFKITRAGSTGEAVSFVIAQKEAREVSSFPQYGKNDFLEIWGAPNPAHMITLRAYFDPTANNVATTVGECEPGDSLYNVATIALPGGKDGASAFDCADFEEDKFGGKLEVKKTVVPFSKEQAWGEVERNGVMTKYIDYTIAVTAPDKESDYKYWYTVTDEPDFGADLKVTDVDLIDVEGKKAGDFNTVVRTSGVEVLSVVFKNKETRQKSYGPQMPHEFLEIWPGQTHTLHVRAYFDKVDEDKPATTGDVCQAGDGLYNMATLGLPNETEGPSDDACAPFVDDEPEEEPGVTVGVAKMNEKNEYLPIGTEYSFSIYDKDGTEVKLDHVEEHGDSSTTFEIKKSKEQALKVGERYTLVETKAPAGFELLAEAVAFTVQRAEDGELGLEIEDAHRHPQVQVLTLGDKQDENSVYFAVADMRQGDLPASGDRGVFWTLGLGIAALIAAAGATLRRRA